MSRVPVRRILSRQSQGYVLATGLSSSILGRDRRVWKRERRRRRVLHRQLTVAASTGATNGEGGCARACAKSGLGGVPASVRDAAGLESQFDWKGPVKGLIAGTPESAVHFFRFVLAWSRARWTLVVPDLKLPATLAALNWAFGKAGGVTQRLVLDNPKTCVTRPKPHLELHPQFLAFCRHFGCEPDPAWPYHPERKGKTERSLRDLDEEGVLGTTYSNLVALQAAVTAVDEARLERVHTRQATRPRRGSNASARR